MNRQDECGIADSHSRSHSSTSPSHSPRQGQRIQLTHLNDAELRLMLQWLDGRSKQAAARTCKRLFHSANHRLAWVGSMHRVRLRIDEPNKLIHLRHPYFLLRHANLCLAVHCSGISNNEAEAFLEQLVTSLTSPPHNLHLHQLDLSYVMMLSSRLCLILQPIHSLRSLHLPRRIWIGSVELHRLTHFPHLCELHTGLDVSALSEVQGGGRDWRQ